MKIVGWAQRRSRSGRECGIQCPPRHIILDYIILYPSINHNTQHNNTTITSANVSMHNNTNDHNKHHDSSRIQYHTISCSFISYHIRLYHTISYSSRLYQIRFYHNNSLILYSGGKPESHYRKRGTFHLFLLRPVRLLRAWVSKGLTRADS